jgi:hypothetical protein
LIATEVQPAGDAIRAKVGTGMGVIHVVDALDVAGRSGILYGQSLSTTPDSPVRLSQ